MGPIESRLLVDNRSKKCFGMWFISSIIRKLIKYVSLYYCNIFHYNEKVRPAKRSKSHLLWSHDEVELGRVSNSSAHLENRWVTWRFASCRFWKDIKVVPDLFVRGITL